MLARGFILKPGFGLESGRPVVRLYGRLDTGASFLVRETREVPRFWIERVDEPRALALGARLAPESPTRTALHGGPVVRVEAATPADLAAWRERLSTSGIRTFEADVPFAHRLLIARGLRGGVEIEGRSRRGRRVDLVFDDPELRPAAARAPLRVLSIDIETDPSAERLYSIALAGCGASEVLLVARCCAPPPRGAVPCADERELLETLVRRVRELDPDVVTGWSVVDFDLAVLARRAARVGVALELGRGAAPLSIRRAQGERGAARASVAGRLVLDGIELLRGAFVRMESYSLDAVAQSVLGRRKLIVGPDRAREITRRFHEDPQALVDYNLEDAKLVLEILERLGLIELAVERSRLTGLPLDRVSASIAAFDLLYLTELDRRRIVAPTVEARDETPFVTAGGHVLDPQPGLYRNVIVLDFKSLYPSVIRTFQIDPLGWMPHGAEGADAIVAPNGAAFRREPGILPAMLDRLVPARAAARAAGDRVADQAIKILMNSFYGVLGTPACRFASPALANAITGFGREMLLWSKRRIEERGASVLYGDTDSLFVLSGAESVEDAAELGHALARDVTADLAEHVRRTWDVESRLELEFELVYARLLLPRLRHAAAGARKRYAGLVIEHGRPRVRFTGLEVVRSDWTPLARWVQRVLYRRLFNDRQVAGFLRTVVRHLRAGRLDGLLVYRKRLRRSLEAYTTAAPPHVAAARKLGRAPGRAIEYVITTAGPEPRERVHAPLDHEHYVSRQVRPVAEPVLDLLGLDFDQVIGDARQLRLFD
jgi:DNA polymerase II